MYVQEQKLVPPHPQHTYPLTPLSYEPPEQALTLSRVASACSYTGFAG